ncbi:putative transmembrane domain protein, partial [Chlamydia psittaci 84-8471/1]
MSPEAQGLRAGLTTQQALLEAVEGELSSMEQTDLKKMRLYKIALIILTLVGLAILFVIPVMMIFNISLWIPVVITLGVSLFSGLVSTKLRA